MSAVKASRLGRCCLFGAVLIFAVAMAGAAFAQSPVPGVGAGFGIDGNLLSNSPTTVPFNTANDWVPGLNPVNSAVLDNAGIPIDATHTFHVIDSYTADSNVFATSNKVDDNPATYQWKAGTVPQKDDINNATLHLRNDVFGDLWAFMSGDREATNGDSYIDFEFLQKPFTMNANGTFTSLGPDSGRTVGDLLVTIDLTRGGTQPSFFVQRWSVDPTVPLGFNYLDVAIPAGQAFVAANIDSTVWVPYGAFGATSYAINAFGEAGVNISKLIPSADSCFGISTVFIRTKSSQSASAVLKDMIKPIQLHICKDVTPPSLGCPSNKTFDCDSVGSFGTPTATDNCDSKPTITLTKRDSIPGCSPQAYVLHLTYQAEDACGNLSLPCTQTITVQDTTKPSITCPGPITVACRSLVPNFDTSKVTASDACGTVVKSWVGDQASGPGSCHVTITRTYRATDQCGNFADCTQLINVNDSIPPVISTLPGPTTIQCPAVPSFTTPTATDACDASPSLTFADTTTSGKCAGDYSVKRTWTAKDACGNTSIATQTINVQDTLAPVISTLPGPTTIECPAVPSFATPTATDACDPNPSLTFADTTTQGKCAGDYSVKRTWTAKDACGNTSIATQTINVQDTLAPVISTLPGPTTIQCPAVPSFATPTARDACDPNPSLTFADTTTQGKCAGDYSVKRTWTAKDACGNTSIATQTINVQDTLAPVISTLPGPTTIECPAVPSFATPTATDVCDPNPSLTFADTTTKGKCAQDYSVKRTWTAKDACGNTSIATQTINVQDTLAPVISTLPGPTTIECPAVPSFATPTATDACDPNPSLTFADTTTPGRCPQDYSVKRTWTAKDACGNTSFASQTINVQDTLAPVISTLPGPTTIECPAVPSFATPTATDACDPNPSLTFADTTTKGKCAQDYSVKRTWTAKDACGNTSVASQTINVQDTLAPVISTLPGPTTIDCPAVPSFATPTATDACDPEPSLTFADTTTQGKCAGDYSVKRTWTAKDACGNTSYASQTINVQDTLAPVISTLPGPTTIDCPAVPSFTTPTATDACDREPSLTFADTTTQGKCAGNYSVKRTWTAKDACGNTSIATQTINVQDTLAPVISSVPAPDTIECPRTVEFASPTATDACDPKPSLTYVDTTTAGRCAQSYSVTRTWTATDACGNSSKKSQTITVEDRTAPVCSVPNDTAFFQCQPASVCLKVSATDLCDTNPVCVIRKGVGKLAEGMWCYTPAASEVDTVVIACSDACLNTCVDTFVVKFHLNAPPVIECRTDTLIASAGDTAKVNVVISDPDGNLDTVKIISIVLNGTPTVPDHAPTIDRAGHFAWVVDPRTGVWGFAIQVVDSCGAADTCNIYIKNPPKDQFCTFTQGFYGNAGGKFCGITAPNIIAGLITPTTPLTVGKPGRSLTFLDGSEGCITARLPANNTPTTLPATLGDQNINSSTCQTSPPIPVNSKGKFLNVLLGQTITLALNTRYDGDLGALGLCSIMTTQKALPGPDGSMCTHADNVLDPGPDGILGTADDPITTDTIPAAVFTALTNLGLSQTVNGLLELANRGLAGWPTGGATLAQINSAVDAINTGFDGCRFLISCGVTPVFAAATVSTAAKVVPSTFELGQNYPNPFNPTTVISYSLAKDAQVELAIFNILGQKVAILATGQQAAGRYTVTWNGTDRSGHQVASGIYFYRLVADEAVETRKMMLLK